MPGNQGKQKLKMAANAAFALLLVLVVVFLVRGDVAQDLNNILSDREPPRRFSAEQNVVIVPHKALYSLALISAQTGSPVVDIKGQLFFKWEDVCDGWETDHRFSMQYFYVDRPPLSATSDFVAWEAKGGKNFRFSSESTENGERSEVLRGTAERDDEGAGTALFSKPKGLSYSLARGFFFSSEHTLELVARAKAGEKLFNSIMFDGTDRDGPVEVNAVIGPEIMAADTGAGKDLDKELLQGRSWKIRLAFFSLKERESAPLYEMTIVLHENGVVSYISVDYKAFSVEQKLKALEKLPPGKC